MESKKIIVIQRTYYPSKKAHAHQIYRMCLAFAHNRCNVELWLPSPFRKKRLAEDEWERYYGDPKRFEVKYFPVLPTINEPRSALVKAIAAFIERINRSIFAISTIIRLTSSKGILFAFTRDAYCLVLFRLCLGLYREKPYLIAELHDIPVGFKKIIVKYALHSVDLIIAISKGLKEFLIEAFPNIRSRIIVLPDGVSSDRLKTRMSREEAVAHLSLEKLENKIIIVYTGHLYPHYGVDVLISAIRYLDKDKYIVWLVGGEDEDIKRTQELANKLATENIVFWGWQDPGKVKYFQWAADILVAPYSAKEDRLYKFCSPLKIFEYMSAQRPIVASRLPALQEILIDRKNALLFEPDNAQDLARCIGMLSNDPILSRTLAAQAFNDVYNFTWEKRARKICEMSGAALAVNV